VPSKQACDQITRKLATEWLTFGTIIFVRKERAFLVAFATSGKRLLEAGLDGADGTNEPPYGRKTMFCKLLIIW
jgi:hypothetical protein